MFLQDGYRLALPETCGECRLSRELGDLYKVYFAKLGPEFFNKKNLELVKLVPGGRARAADMWVVFFAFVVIADFQQSCKVTLARSAAGWAGRTAASTTPRTCWGFRPLRAGS